MTSWTRKDQEIADMLLARTVLQPLVATEEDFVEVSVTEAVEVAGEDAAVVVGYAEVAAARRTRSGSP